MVDSIVVLNAEPVMPPSIDPARTALLVRLSAQGVDTLMMAGIASTGVVLSSVAYASDADFRLLTVKDCCFDPDQVVHERLFATAFESRTTVLSLDDALALLT